MSFFRKTQTIKPQHQGTGSRLTSRLALIVAIAAMLTTQLTFPAHALPPGQAKVFDDGIKMFNINEDVTTCDGGGNGSGGSSPLVGSDNVQKAFNYFVSSRGLSPNQAAGIIGNLLAESNMVPDIVQGGGTAPAPVPGKGYGIAQWTDAARQNGLIALAQQEGKPASDLGLQLDYLWQELNTTEKAALADLKANTVYVQGKSGAYNAAVSFLVKFERAKDHAIDGPNAQKRGGSADEIVARYGGGTPSGTPSANGPGGCTAAGSVACNSSGAPSSTAGATGNLSAVRQTAVCLAQQELAAWQQPGVQPQELCKKYGADKGAAAPWCEEWCADFISYLYKNAGYPLQPEPNWRVAAVSGIMAIGQKEQNFHWHPIGSGYVPRPGDISIRKNGMSHTNLVISVSGNTITYIGGDEGSGPYGGANSKSVVQQSTSQGGLSGYVSPD